MISLIHQTLIFPKATNPHAYSIQLLLNQQKYVLKESQKPLLIGERKKSEKPKTFINYPEPNWIGRDSKHQTISVYHMISS